MPAGPTVTLALDCRGGCGGADGKCRAANDATDVLTRASMPATRVLVVDGMNTPPIAGLLRTTPAPTTAVGPTVNVLPSTVTVCVGS